MSQLTNILSPELRANPYPFYAELRRSRPVCQVDPGGMWAVTRYEDVLFILKHPELFSSQGFRAAWQPPWLDYNPLAHSMLAMDGQEHGRLRALVTRVFGPKAIARLEPKMRRVAEELADAIVARKEADFAEAFSLPFPTYVIGELIGMGSKERQHFKRWTDDLMSVTPAPQGPEHIERVRTTIRELTGYVTEVIADRRQRPADDLVTDLIQAEADGARLTDAELVSFLSLLLLGGFDTTTYLVSNAFLILAERPELFARLRAQPALVPSFVEEVLRFEPPVHGVPRITTSDVSIAGVTVPRGSLVLAVIGSANRDEQRYPNPDWFELERGQSGVPFGHGLHACLGAALARVEARLAVEVLLSRADAIERLPGNLSWIASLTVRGPQALPLRFTGSGSSRYRPSSPQASPYPPPRNP